jgi:teichuronic acid biosynthesis glycosyltransferase TuaG
MHITILMPIYNGIEFLPESITSILNQTYPHWEVLIGINGHPANSEVFQKAKEYESEKVKVLDFPNIKGKSNTLNEMVKHASYDHISLLDVDDIWLPEKLEKQINILKTQDYDVIGTQCQYFGDLRGSPNIQVGEIQNECFKTGNQMINSSIIMKKELAFWDENYESVEDYECWVRLATQYKTFYNIPEILVKHRVHRKSAFNTDNRQALYIQKIKSRYY